MQHSRKTSTQKMIFGAVCFALFNFVFLFTTNFAQAQNTVTDQTPVKSVTDVDDGSQNPKATPPKRKTTTKKTTTQQTDGSTQTTTTKTTTTTTSQDDTVTLPTTPMSAATVNNMHVYTIKDSVQETLNNNPTLKQYREAINQAIENKNLVRSYVFPTLTYNLNAGSAQAATLNNPAVLFGGSTYNNYNGSLVLVQPLFVYGSLDAISSADYGKKLNTVAVELQERTLTQQVITSFYNIVLNQRLLDFLMETKGVLEKSLDVTTYRYRIGRAQLLDVLQAKTQLASLLPQIEQARNSYLAAGVSLVGLMGMQSQTQIEVRGQLKTLIYKNIESQFDWKNYYLPELEQNKLQIQQLVENKEVEMGKYWPTLKFTGTYGSNAYTQSDFVNPSAQSWSAMFGVSIPIFQGFASKYDNAVYVSEELQLKHARSQLEETLYVNQVTNKTTLDSSEVSLTTAIEADRLAQESLAEAIRQYKLATIDFLQFLTIEQTALTAKSQVETLRYQSIVAYTNYFVAMGQPLNKLIDILQ